MFSKYQKEGPEIVTEEGTRINDSRMEDDKQGVHTITHTIQQDIQSITESLTFVKFLDGTTILYCAAFFVLMVLMEIVMESTFKSYNKGMPVNLLADFITLMQFFWCFLLAYIKCPENFKTPKSGKLFGCYFLLSMLIFCASGLATMSLNFVSYPTKVVFKSAKLVPALLVSSFLLGKIYKWFDFVAASLLCIGAACYTYDNSKSSQENSIGFSNQLIGVTMLCISVFCDAFAPNITQYVMTGKLSNNEPISAEEIMLNTNGIGFVCLGSVMLIRGDISEAIAMENFTIGCTLSVACVGLFTAAAVNFYTHIIKRSGSVTAVTAATLRKIVTIILSYAVFPKEILIQHYIGTLAVIAGIILESFSR